MLVSSGLFSSVFNSTLCLPAAGADHQAPLAAFPPVLTFRMAFPPPPQKASPSCCGSSGPRFPSSWSSCSWLVSRAWCPWRRRTTAATTPTTLPAPSTPCCATPTDLHPSESSSWTSWSTSCFAEDSTECFLFTQCPEVTNPAIMLYEVIQRWYQDFSLLRCSPRNHLNPLNPLSRIDRRSFGEPPFLNLGIPCRFKLNECIIFQGVWRILRKQWEQKHYLYTVCWAPKSTVLFVNDIQGCYYLFKVRFVYRLYSVLIQLQNSLECGVLCLRFSSNQSQMSSLLLTDTFGKNTRTRRLKQHKNQLKRSTSKCGWTKKEPRALTWALSELLALKTADFFPQSLRHLFLFWISVFYLGMKKR